MAARKKLKIARLVDERTRSFVLQQKTAALFKKAEEFSILCGIEIGVVVFSPEGNTESYVVWPSRDKFIELVAMYLSKPLAQRLYKLTTLESYLQKEMEAERENAVKRLEKNKEMEELFSHIYVGEKTTFELDKRQLRGVLDFALAVKEKVAQRRKQLNEQNDDDDPLALRLAPPVN